MPQSDALRIAVIGAGATGTLLATHLLRQQAVPVQVALIERSGVFGLGAAYSAVNPDHTLNVPAHLMGGIDLADTDGFVHWVAARSPGADLATLRMDYIARELYGKYLRELLARGCREALRDSGLTEVHGEAVGIEPVAGGYRVRLQDGRVHDADAVALCLGNLDPPRLGSFDDERALEHPWRPDALATVESESRILMVGTALTMIDAVLDLERRDFRGSIVAVSRRGLVPLEDAPPVAYPDFFPVAVADRGIRAVMRRLRDEVRTAAAQDIGWHSVVEAFRVHAAAIWMRLDDANRYRFLRHVRSVWLAHRHRLPPRHMRRIDALRDAGRLRVLAARVVAIRRGAGGFEVEIRRRGAVQSEIVPADWILNCTGPEGDYARADTPLIRSLLAIGLGRPDPYRLGLEVDADCTLVRADGSRAEALFAVGPPTRGRFWEVVAVPHIRRQIEALVAQLCQQDARRRAPA